jgi:hypothetical protein
MIVSLRLTTQVLITLRMSKWYATEALNSVKKRFRRVKKKSKHEKNKIRSSTQSFNREDRMLQTEKQTEDEINLSESICSICLKQSSQIQTLCDHKFCRECFDIYERVSERNFLCSYCRKNLARDHDDLVWINENKRRKRNDRDRIWHKKWTRTR